MALLSTNVHNEKEPFLATKSRSGTLLTICSQEHPCGQSAIWRAFYLFLSQALNGGPEPSRVTLSGIRVAFLTLLPSATLKALTKLLAAAMHSKQARAGFFLLSLSEKETAEANPY